MHKNATKCNKTQGKWCINKHGASKIIDTFETYQGCVPRAYTCGLPPRIKEITVSFVFDRTFSAAGWHYGLCLDWLIVGVQPMSMTWGGSIIIGGTGHASMVAHSFSKVSSHSSLSVEWVLRWKCTTPAGYKTNRLAMSPVMDNLSL
jgi:hypothetical protein